MWKIFKKTWFILILLVIFSLGRLERCAFRYDRDDISQKISDQVNIIPTFKRDSSHSKGLHYIQVGDNPDHAHLVFVHGSPGSLWDYGQYLTDSSLVEAANLVSVDRPGFGYSEFGHAEVSLQKQADQLAAVLRKLPNRQIVLVGHSLGGPVIAKTAMEYPELVKGLVMIAPSISPEHEPSNGWRKLINFPLLRWLAPPALRACNQEIIPLKEELLKMQSGWSHLRMPTTIIQGALDKLVPMGNAQFAKDMMPQNPQVKLIILENENHFILWSKDRLVKQELKRILVNL